MPLVSFFWPANLSNGSSRAQPLPDDSKPRDTKNEILEKISKTGILETPESGEILAGSSGKNTTATQPSDSKQ